VFQSSTVVLGDACSKPDTAVTVPGVHDTFFLKFLFYGKY